MQLQIIILLLSAVFTSQAGGVVESGKINEPNCEGSLVITDLNNKDHSWKEWNPKDKVGSARVDGCGCFTVHSGRNGRGQSQPIKGGSNQDIDFPKIRSVTPACQKRGSPSWLVIVIVVAVVLIVLVLALVGIKYYRSRFNRLPQDDPES